MKSSKTNHLQQLRYLGRDITPSKIVCVGRNYVAHIHELGNDIPEEMVVFVKPNSAISEVLHASHCGEALHYEGELSFLVEDGRFAALGFGLDLTKRELQGTLKSRGLPWERAKGFDGAALFSEFVKIPDSLNDIHFELDINGQIIQSGNVQLMMYKPQKILNELASFMTLTDGDVVMTGTPKGVGRVNVGDKFTARIYHSGKVLVSAVWDAV